MDSILTHGRKKGGDGIIREYEFKAPARVSILSERRRYAPYGIAGGNAGKPGRNILIREGKETLLPSKINLQLNSGDLLRIETPGGGGYGKED